MDNIIKNIPIENIILNQSAPVNNNELNTLSQSIKKYGIVEPLLVRQKEDKYEIISGRKRYLAAKNIGLKEIPVLVRNIEEDFYSKNKEPIKKEKNNNKFINPNPNEEDILPKNNTEITSTPNNDTLNTVNIQNNYNNNNSDIINLSELNKKEFERDELEMNNQIMNEQGVQPQNFSAPQGQAPTFGGRFFPSLEDEPTNMNMGGMNIIGEAMNNAEPITATPVQNNELIDLTDDTNETTTPQFVNNQEPTNLVNPLDSPNTQASVENTSFEMPQNNFSNNIEQNNYQEQPLQTMNSGFPAANETMNMEQPMMTPTTSVDIPPENNYNQMNNYSNPVPQQEFTQNTNQIEQPVMEPQFDMSQSMMPPQNNVNQQFNPQEQATNNEMNTEMVQPMDNMPVYNNQPEMNLQMPINNNIPNIDNQMPVQQETVVQPVQQDFLQPELPTNDIQQFPQKDVGPVVNTIKNLVNSLKEFGYEINISENDLGSSTQITIDIQK